MAKAQHRPRYRSLPALLKKLRTDAGLPQRDLGEKLQMAHVAVHKSETGDRRVDVAEFVDWIKACKADPVEVFKLFAGIKR